MPISGSEVERCAPTLRLKIDVTSSSKDLRHDDRMPISGHEVERRDPIRVLVVDEGLRTLCRQQITNLRSVTITRGLAKLLTRN